MSDATPTDEGNCWPSLGARVEAMCDRFEAAWKAGLRPRIEDYVGEVPEVGRAALLRALVALDLAYRRQNGERPTPEEYQCRFPEHVAVIETILGVAPPPRAARPRAGADHNLLSGILALQNNFIDREALLAAFAAWVTDKSRDLGRILLESSAVDAETHALIEALARKHLQMHGGDLEESLAALSSLGSVRDDLERLYDADLQGTLDHVPAARTEQDDDVYRTVPPSSVGDSTSTGARFRILRLHRTGGLGAVYVARDEELHREVALKEIRDRHAHDPDSRSRFVQEAEITGRLEHPGIVPVYGLGTYADGRPFYAMRFIKGDNLKDAIARFHEADVTGRDPGERALALRELLGRFVAVCNAMAYAHSRGIVHRDLKPSNILLGPYGETLVVDWGLAKPVGRLKEASRTEASRAAEETLRPDSAGSGKTTLPGDTPGTPAYMSPEQAAGDLDRLGLASDVYSLGATLYCLLTGRAPFEDRDVGVVLGKVQRGEFLPPRADNRAIDPALEAICLKAMSLLPEDRYITPAALAEDLDRWLAGEPASAWREPYSIRARRWTRRNRTVVSSVAAALVVSVIGLAALAVAQSRAKSALEAKNLQLIAANAATTKEKNKAESALNETQEAKRATEEALAQKGAALGFLKNDVLAAARPEGQEGGLGVDVTVRKAVDAAERKIAGAFKDQPIVEADVRDALGITYYYLGEVPLAIRQHERAVELRQERLGPDDPDTLASRNDLADAYQAAGFTDKAITMYKAILKQRELKLGADHPDTLESRSNLAVAYEKASLTLEAIKMHEATLKQRESKLGLDHPDTLKSRNNLAAAYYAAGRIDQAIKMHEETLKRRQATLGHDHPDTLNSRNNLAAAYLAAHRTDEAIIMYEATLEQQESKLGRDHPKTLASRNNLGGAYLAAGQIDRAVSLLEQALQGFRAKGGPDHPYTLTTEQLLADAYNAAGQYTRAERLLRDGLERARKQFGSVDLRTARAMAQLGENLNQQRNWAQAETVLRECVAIRGKAQPDDWRTFNSRSLLGGSLLGQKKFADAEPLILAGYEGMKAREAKIAVSSQFRLTQAAKRVVQLYEAWGKKEKSEEWRRKLGEKTGIDTTAEP